MAFRTESFQVSVPQVRGEAADRLAALPTGVIAAVFDSRVDAVTAAVQLAHENPDASVWIATGAGAALNIRAARAARSFLHRLIGGLSDDEVFVRHVIQQAERDKTVLVVQPRDARATLTRLAGARHIIEFGRWTTRPIR